MSKFSFSNNPVLDRYLCKQTNVQTAFDDIETRVNTDKFDIDQFRKYSVRYRHLGKPGVIYLRSRKEGTEIFAGVLNKVGVINVTNCKIFHTAGVDSAPAGDRQDMPPYAVYAEYTSNYWKESAYEIIILYTTDAGATWLEYPYTSRWLGVNHAKTSVLWSAKTTHPMTAALTAYWPPSMYSRRICRTQVAVMDMTSAWAGVKPTNIDGYAIGIRVNGPGSSGGGTHDVHELDMAKIQLVGRENTF